MFKLIKHQLGYLGIGVRRAIGRGKLTPAPVPTGGNFWLQEDGVSYVLQEDSASKIATEA